jgi:replicative DNA helicase
VVDAVSKNKGGADLGAERVIVSALIQQGAKALAEIEPTIQKSDLSSLRNQALYECAKSIIEDQTIADSITPDLILTTAKEKGLEQVVSEDINYLQICCTANVNMNELPHFLRAIKVWSVSQQLRKKLENSIDYVNGLTGKEGLLDVISNVENTIFDFIPSMLQSNDSVNMGDFAEEHIRHLAENPVEIVGLPTGFPRYDNAIGGGYRRGSVSIVAARPKVGKSTFCLNVANHLASQDIPILYLDTELRKEEQAVRFTALNSKVPQDKIETGSFVHDMGLKTAVEEALQVQKLFPFEHINVAGCSMSEMLSIMRRWVNLNVGRDENGNMKDCLIILDYLKTMDLEDIDKGFAEHQYLGDMVTKMQNFAVKYDVPIMTAIQVNRDGISREDTSVISISDRVLWLCSNMTLLKRKTDEDYASGDERKFGDRKLVVLETRFGEGMEKEQSYINVISNLDRCEFTEGKYNFENSAYASALGDQDAADVDSIFDDSSDTITM